MTIAVDLKRNPEVADLIADMEPGDKVSLITSIKSKNGELAEFTLERAEEGPAADDNADDNDDEAVVDGTQQKKHAKMPAPGGSPNTPGGSQEQDRKAAALTAQL